MAYGLWGGGIGAKKGLSYSGEGVYAGGGANAWLNVDVETPPEFEELRQSLLRLADEISRTEEYLIAIADEAYVEQGELAYEEAEQVPLKPQTLERKKRGRGKTQRARETERYFYANRQVYGPAIYKRSRKYKRRNLHGVSRSTEVLNADGGPSSMWAAFTLPFAEGKHSNVARREILGDTLVWGSKGLLTEHLSYHVTGTRDVPPRLIRMLEPETNPDFVETERQVWASFMVSALEKAGAPADWIQEAMGGYG